MWYMSEKKVASESDMRKVRNRCRGNEPTQTEQPNVVRKASRKDAVTPRLFVSSGLFPERASSLMTITAKHLDGRRHKDRR